jgi:hypothetical protein
MDHRFDIRWSGPKQQFEEEVILKGLLGEKETEAIMDTGATISIVDLEYALSLGADLVGLSKVTGVSGISSLIYLVRLRMKVTHEREGASPLIFVEVVTMGAMPYFQSGGDQPMVFIQKRGSASKTPVPLLVFKVGFPGVKLDEVRTLMSNLLVSDKTVVIEDLHLQAIGVPLLLGVDIMKVLADRGFPIDFEFKGQIVRPSIF